MEEERACYFAHRAAVNQKKPEELLRFEDDHQGGGSWVRYTPGVTECWSCGETINDKGKCGRLCSTLPLPLDYEWEVQASTTTKEETQ